MLLFLTGNISFQAHVGLAQPTIYCTVCLILKPLCVGLDSFYFGAIWRKRPEFNVIWSSFHIPLNSRFYQSLCCTLPLVSSFYPGLTSSLYHSLPSSPSYPPPLFFLCRLYPAAVQFSVFLLAYMLLLLLALAEEFKWAPTALQHLCCWIHENNSARNLLTLTAIVINFGLVSTDMVRV